MLRQIVGCTLAKPVTSRFIAANGGCFPSTLHL